MHDIRRIAAVACVLLVTLRLFIGWQFFYEGMWKLQTMKTADEWTAAGYLKNAQGPLRPFFRDMVGDPDDLNWLDYEWVTSRWDTLEQQIVGHYGLDESQQAKLHAIINGEERITAAPLTKVPDGIVWPTEPKERTGKELASVLQWDGKQLIANTKEPVKPSEIAWAQSLVPISVTPNGQYAYVVDGNTTVNADITKLGAPDDQVAYYKALERIEILTSRGLGYKNRARASLIGDPDRKGVTAVLRENQTYAPAMKTTKASGESKEADSIVYGEIQVYKDLLDEFESYMDAESRGLEFRQEHATKIAQKVRSKWSEVVEPIQNFEDDLKDEALTLLTVEQLSRGDLAPERNPLWAQSQRAMWGLIILGSLLILGLATRFAALGGAVMLMMFYLVWPPWPGVPSAPGPEHSLVVNKNLIEVVALLAIAAMPTGTWFGIDGIFTRLFAKAKAKRKVA